MEAVAGHTHLYRRGAVYWFRRRVPEDVVSVVGHAQWRSSLGTKDFEEAKRLVRLRGVETDGEVALARARLAGKVSPPLTKPEANRLAQQWVVDMLAWNEEYRGRHGRSVPDRLACDTQGVTHGRTKGREGWDFPPGQGSQRLSLRAYQRFVERLYSAQWIHDLPPQQTSNLRVKAKTWWKLLFLPCYSP